MYRTSGCHCAIAGKSDVDQNRAANATTIAIVVYAAA
jgi:hypothetical protein